MSCARGKADPDQATRIRLFADSAGYCQNPSCARHLFVESSNGEAVHFAEMAHIFAASARGPRPNSALSDEERASYDNLILLCAICHTIIDKAPGSYPDTMITKWKRDRADHLAALFGAVHLASRVEVRHIIEPLLIANKSTLDTYGPGSDAQFDPESDAPAIWQRKMLSVIIPNNKRIIAVLDKNRDHMCGREPVVFEEFRQHTDDLVARHLEGVVGGRMFPSSMNKMMQSDG